MEAITQSATLILQSLNIVGLTLMLRLMRRTAWGIWWFPCWVLIGVSGMLVAAICQDHLHLIPPAFTLGWRRVVLYGALFVGVAGRVLWMVDEDCSRTNDGMMHRETQ